MDRKKQITILLISIGILILLLVSFMVINIINESKKNIYYANAQEVTDNIKYLEIVEIVNNLYDNISHENKKYLLDVFNDNYIQNNNLNENNILDSVNTDRYYLKKYVTKLSGSCNKNNCYYFAELEGYKTNFDGSIYKKDITSYLLIIEDLNTKTYSIMPLNNVSNLENYINKYEFKDITINKNDNNGYVSDVEVNDTETIRYYLSYVEYLLMFNSSNISQYFENYNENKKINYLNKIGNTLYSYEKDIKDKTITYHGMLYDGSLFTLKITSPMKFIIAFE